MNTMAQPHQTRAGLAVEIIDTKAELQAIESGWKALEARDPEMTFFLSWNWLTRAFYDNPFRWSVLAVRDSNSGDIVGLLPLKYRVHWSNSRNEFQTELEAGGRLLFSEYTGFLCAPEFEQLVLETLANALCAMPWAKLSMRYVAQHRRAKLFCDAFESPGFDVSWKEYRINKGETDNLICPRVPLPDDFETYLTTRISANTRQRYRRFQRNFFASGEYRFTHSDAESFDRDAAGLMDFWMQKWEPLKGRKSAEKVAANFHKVLEAALQTDSLFLPTLWRGETRLAALGHIMDPREGAMHFIIAGRNPTAEEPFLGAALHFHSIECAILLGCEDYDFGHGNEPYKFSYGAEENKVHYFSIRRPEQAETFDSISTGAAVKRIEQFIKAGKTDKAQRACQQLSRVFR